MGAALTFYDFDRIDRDDERVKGRVAWGSGTFVIRDDGRPERWDQFMFVLYPVAVANDEFKVRHLVHKEGRGVFGAFIDEIGGETFFQIFGERYANRDDFGRRLLALGLRDISDQPIISEEAYRIAAELAAADGEPKWDWLEAEEQAGYIDAAARIIREEQNGERIVIWEGR